MVAKKLHLVMYPWLAFGHITPFLHLANELGKRGHKTTLLLPHKARLQLEPLNLHPSYITLHPITIPRVPPLPLGAETASDIPFPLHRHLVTALDLSRPEIESIIATLRPDLIFYEGATYWVAEVASKLEIKSVCYNVISAATLAFSMVPARKVPNNRLVTEEDVAQPPLGYPSPTVVVEPTKMMGWYMRSDQGLSMYDRVTAALSLGNAIALRTCQEVEGKFCDYLASQYDKPVLLSGPVLPEQEHKAELEAQWGMWLGQFSPASVVFCAFGSQLVLSKKQFQELLIGFEETGMPFLVALKLPTGCSTVAEAIPENYMDRVGERGRVTGEWIQQPLILAHPSIGCFVNHCGFGSMWESLLSKNQIVLIPELPDQVLNTKILAGELKVALEVERGKDGWVSKESLCEAVKSVMGKDSDIGNAMRKNHDMWRAILGSPMFMSGYIDKFIRDLQDLID